MTVLTDYIEGKQVFVIDMMVVDKHLHDHKLTETPNPLVPEIRTRVQSHSFSRLQIPMRLASHPLSALIALVAGLNVVTALDAHGWRHQSIYQLLTDRFAREDEANVPCDLPARKYCGGTWRGLSQCGDRHFRV